MYNDIKEEAYECNMLLPKLNLVLFTFGNVSVADRDKGVFAIKPSGIPYEELKADQIVVVDFDGNIVEGNMRPSSDTKTHAVLYKHWDIGGITHTHSVYGTAWAQSLRDIPIFGTTHADHLTKDIPCAAPMKDEQIKGNYEYETGFQILDHFKENNLNYKEIEMVLVGSHAPFSWGKDGQKSVYNAAVLEEVAKMALLTEQINPQAQRMKDSLIQKHWDRKHGADAYYGQQ